MDDFLNKPKGSPFFHLLLPAFRQPKKNLQRERAQGKKKDDEAGSTIGEEADHSRMKGKESVKPSAIKERNGGEILGGADY